MVDFEEYFTSVSQCYSYSGGIFRRHNFHRFRKIRHRMMNFWKAPSIKFFNYVINSDGELYVKTTEYDPSDEFYVEYMNETVSMMYKRRQEAAEKLANPEPEYKSLFKSQIILAWAYAAVKEFPWLIPHCEHLLYLERAQKFINSSFTDDMINTLAGPQLQPECDSTPAPSEKTKQLRLKTRAESGFGKWLMNVDRMSILLSFQFGASGDLAYLKRADEITSRLKPLHLFNILSNDEWEALMSNDKIVLRVIYKNNTYDKESNVEKDEKYIDYNLVKEDINDWLEEFDKNINTDAIDEFIDDTKK